MRILGILDTSRFQHHRAQLGTGQPGPTLGPATSPGLGSVDNLRGLVFFYNMRGLTIPVRLFTAAVERRKAGREVAHLQPASDQGLTLAYPLSHPQTWAKLHLLFSSPLTDGILWDFSA